MRKLLRVLISLVLSLATIGGISLLNRLPYGPTRDAITDGLSLPGGLIAWLFYASGVHSGHADQWAWLAMGGNLLFYTVIWFLVLYWFSIFRRRRQGPPATAIKATSSPRDLR